MKCAKHISLPKNFVKCCIYLAFGKNWRPEILVSHSSFTKVNTHFVDLFSNLISDIKEQNIMICFQIFKMTIIVNDKELILIRLLSYESTPG